MNVSEQASLPSKFQVSHKFIKIQFSSQKYFLFFHFLNFYSHDIPIATFPPPVLPGLLPQISSPITPFSSLQSRGRPNWVPPHYGTSSPSRTRHNLSPLRPNQAVQVGKGDPMADSRESLLQFLGDPHESQIFIWYKCQRARFSPCMLLGWWLSFCEPLWAQVS